MTMESEDRTLTSRHLLREKLGAEGLSSARMLIGSLNPSEVARLLESLPLQERAVVWEIIDPENEGGISGPLQTVQISGQSGLIRTFEQEEMGDLLIGRQYIVAKGDRAAILHMWALESVAEEFEPEFEAIAQSFELLP